MLFFHSRVWSAMAAEINMQELKEETLRKIREMALEPQSGSFLITRA